ncbi:MAG: M56 family metallopeptidase [Candidatus Aquicultor sp.]|nr:M56 family metallopeptidase [Candidatus Aquicultor sp.]
MPVWQSLLFNHIIPSIFDAAVMLLLVLIAFTIFRVKNPATRFVFLFLPMLKSFLILLDNPSQVQLLQSEKALQKVLRFPDPLNLITSPLNEVAEFSYSSDAVVLVLLVAGVSVLAVIAARWLQLFLFFNNFSREESLSRSEYPQVYDILDKLVPALGVSYPRVVISNIYQFVPFSVGYRVPIVVISKEFLAEFPDEQLEIMLAHELAHMRRKDYLTSWLTLMLRDLMFINPIIHYIYNKLEDEKEKACDKLALNVTNAAPKTAANMLLDVALFYSKQPVLQHQTYPMLAKGLLLRQSKLEHRINSVKQSQRMKKSSYLRTLLRTTLFVLLVYVQIGVIVNIGGHNIFLR